MTSRSSESTALAEKLLHIIIFEEDIHFFDRFANIFSLLVFNIDIDE